MANYLYMDTEYSSFFSPDKSKSGDLIQLSCIAVIDGIEAGRFNEYCKPIGKNWNKNAESVHGIPITKANTFQHPRVLADKLNKFITSFDTRFICAGWSSSGDKKYVERLVADYGLIMEWHTRVKPKWRDVLDRAKERKKSIPTKDMKLGTVADFFNIELEAHNAMSDAVVTWKIDEFLNSIKPDGVTGTQCSIGKMSEIEMRKKYIDSKYIMINGDGCVYITEHATSNPDALKTVMQEIWDLYIDKE